MSSESILIIDDNPANQKLARVTLALEGFITRTADNAQAAIVVLEQFRPDLILMDVQLPDMDGLELTRRFKASSTMAHIPIIAMTAYAMSGDEQRIHAAGCDGYISKPIDVRQLPALVRAHLSRKKPSMTKQAGTAKKQLEPGR
ncbi:MAG TPA: response regulator [Candidatus Binatus sp.]|nr:response regulator [Candidatus Binatus sp.]